VKAIRVSEFGTPDVLRLEQAECPVPAEGQVLVTVRTAGVGYGDIIVRSGRHPFPVPYVPGLEVGAQALAATADGGGRFGLYGFTSGSWIELDAHQIGRRGTSVVGALGIAFAEPAAEQRADAEEALREAAAGRLVPRIHGSFPLERAAQAHAAVESRATVGAVVLTP
jgi:NADPH:quinone reductase-like Zn-dependent oxidoreductase